MLLKERQIANDWGTFKDFCNQRISGLSTGIPELDKIILGLRGITCIRGAPGTNKSTLSLQIAAHYSENHGPAIFFDRENGINRLRLRILCQSLNLSEIELTLKILKSGDSLKDDIEKLKQLPFFVLYNEPIKSITDVIEEVQQKYQKPALLVIDSLQKLKMNLDKRRDSIDTWLNELDELKVKHENNLKIIFTSEKNYQGYHDPALGGSKDSSEIEYTAESIWDLRPSPANPQDVILHVSKDRDSISKVELELEKVLSDPQNARSFCYKLKAKESVIF